MSELEKLESDKNKSEMGKGDMEARYYDYDISKIWEFDSELGEEVPVADDVTFFSPGEVTYQGKVFNILPGEHRTFWDKWKFTPVHFTHLPESKVKEDDEIVSEIKTELTAETKELILSGKYAQIDPRPQSREKMEEVVSGQPTLGIELTIPELAQLASEGNVDPQHSGDQEEPQAAIEAVTELSFELPSREVQLVTVRPDNDSIGAMAVIKLRQAGVEITPEATDRIERIAKIDKFAMGEWDSEAVKARQRDWEFAGMNSLVSNFKVPLQERVYKMAEYLMTGTTEGLSQMMDEAEINHLQAECAQRKCEIEVLDNSIAVIENVHRGAIALGYEYAPIVVALNPEFTIRGDESPHRKFTIAQFKRGYLDLDRVVEQLNELEPGWGGSSTIAGSPQGVGSRLTLGTVTDIVEANILKREVSQ